jgi:hypothetical protein
MEGISIALVTGNHDENRHRDTEPQRRFDGVAQRRWFGLQSRPTVESL